MAIDLKTYASGDTDYIAKMNANVSDIEAAINGLQQQMDAASGGETSSLSIGQFFQSLFNDADALIGPGSYKPTLSASTVTVAPGGVYIQGIGVVASYSDTPLSFIGVSVGTHYIVVQGSGIPARKSTADPGTIYSVYWNGSSLSGLTPIAPVFYDTSESAASRKSAALGSDQSPPEFLEFPTLDARLEAGEAKSMEALDKANSAMATAQTIVRKVGITVDASPGVKGAIQIDFDGTIIGWSVIGNAVGDLQVEVSRRGSSPPPAAPQIPDPATNKISASAPIAISAAQSASGDTAAVASWSKTLSRWNVLQFSVVSMTVMSRATLYIRIQEAVPAINPLLSPPELDLEFELPSPPESVDL